MAFPDGSMTASGLRREAGRGRLDITRIAGKDYTTLRAIEEMRVLCRVPPKVPASDFGQHERTKPDFTPRDGSSSTTAGNNLPLAAARKIVEELKERYPTTSPKSTKRHDATVIPLSSRSPT
jgi:hypothetical protein